MPSATGCWRWSRRSSQLEDCGRAIRSTMPIAVAAIAIAAVWPVKPWLDRLLPSSFSYVGTVAVLLLIFAGFMAAVYFSAAQAVQAFTKNWDQFHGMYDAATRWADSWGLSLGGQEGYSRLIGFGQDLLANAYAVFAYLGFIALLVVLGLPEVPSFRAKIWKRFEEGARREVMDAVDEIAGKIRQYLAVTTVTSLLTGVATGLWALLIGLDLALVWAS